MNTWLGNYTPSAVADPVEATVLAYHDKISIGVQLPDQAHSTIVWPLQDLHVKYDPGIQATCISHPAEKGKLEIPGKKAMEFIQQQQQENLKPWFRKPGMKDMRRNMVIFLAVIAIFVSLYLLIVPWIAEKMAGTVSIETETELGNSVFNALNYSASENMRATEAVNDFFQAMHIATPYNIRITVVEDDIVNAFALPGGHIVVYTGLLNRLDSYPELAALLSHEFIHVSNRHSTRSIFRRMGSRIFLSLLLGKMGAVTAVLADQADNLKSLTYSRKLEKEADITGLALLQERKIDPEGFIHLFETLQSEGARSEMPEILESHPEIEKRMEYIRKMSKSSQVTENTELKSIFERIKQSK